MLGAVSPLSSASHLPGSQSNRDKPYITEGTLILKSIGKEELGIGFVSYFCLLLEYGVIIQEDERSRDWPYPDFSV